MSNYEIDNLKKEYYDKGIEEGIEKAKESSYEEGFRDGVQKGIEYGISEEYLHIIKQICEQKLITNSNLSDKDTNLLNKIIVMIDKTDKNNLDDMQTKIKAININMKLCFK